MPGDVVERYRRRLNADERRKPPADVVSPVERAAGRTISLAVADSLMRHAEELSRSAWVTDRTVADRWIAPRLHHALRLTRVEASDRGVWQAVALRYSWFVDWRWANDDGVVAEDRWWGPVHKQAFARLWWGAEIFRDGGDYRPVERAFVLQDLPNSYLHRPVVRCRSLALALVDRVANADNASLSSTKVNDLARVLNLATAGTPPEVETGFQVDDAAAYDAWCESEPRVPDTWDRLPDGPRARDTTEKSVGGAVEVVDRAWSFAGLAETYPPSRSR